MIVLTHGAAEISYISLAEQNSYASLIWWQSQIQLWNSISLFFWHSLQCPKNVLCDNTADILHYMLVHCSN